jgi:hypothetical protein
MIFGATKDKSFDLKLELGVLYNRRRILLYKKTPSGELSFVDFIKLKVIEEEIDRLNKLLLLLE